LRDKVSGVSDRQRKTRRSFEVEVRHGRSAMRCLVAMKPDGGGNEKEMGMKTDVDLYGNATLEQREAIKRMEENEPPSWIFEKIKKDIPQEVPDGTDKPGWTYGSFRICEVIDGKTPYKWDAPEYDKELDLEGRDLSKIGHVIFWKQTAKNKNNPEKPLKRFASIVPFGWAMEVEPGQTVPITTYIPIGTSNEEIERMARESFLKLQEVVKAYYESV